MSLSKKQYILLEWIGWEEVGRAHKVRIRGSWREGAFLGASAVGCVQKFISSGDTGVF